MPEYSSPVPAHHPWKVYDRDQSVKTRLKREADKVEPISIADRRLKLGPDLGTFTHDHVKGKLQPHHFRVVYYLAQNADREVSHAELIKEFYGWTLEHVDENLVAGLHASVSKLRAQLNEELADKESGAIRTVHGIGFIAVSTL